MAGASVRHPQAYSADEEAFLNGLHHATNPIPSESFDRLHELLGRWPTYVLGEDGRFDYDRPIVLNHRFQDGDLAKRGVENLMFHGRLFVREDP